jgi:LPXTG-motif cell wall-anchored protein
VSTKGPVIGPDSIPKDPTPASRHPLPKTGGVIPTGIGAALAAGALALLHLRRKASIA